MDAGGIGELGNGPAVGRLALPAVGVQQNADNGKTPRFGARGLPAAGGAGRLMGDFTGEVWQDGVNAYKNGNETPGPVPGSHTAAGRTGAGGNRAERRPDWG